MNRVELRFKRKGSRKRDPALRGLLGVHHRRAGHARRHLETALAFLRPAAMELWLTEAEAELSAVG
ncbi:MAG: hypothetical protein DMD97_18755 [Candidatus Rokuibacteriota bacterium]|nr:MAG: hypothetical protein DMD97_18755 [Candidatus Rokubacteria bacterium]